MAKQSAKSKGYRKTVKKKPFLTKKEIILLAVIVAAIVVGLVAFNLFYDDGYLGASDVKPGDVASYVSRQIDNRFVKVAEANELAGFTCEQPDLSENPRGTYTYYPDEPVDHIDNISLSGSYVPAADQMASLQYSLTFLGATFTEPQSVEIQGHEASVYSYTTDYYSEEKAAEAGEGEAAEDEAAEDEAAEGEEHPSNVYSQTVGCYVDVDGYTVCFDIYRTGDDESFYLPEDQIVDYLLPYTDAFTVYEKEGK